VSGAAKAPRLEIGLVNNMPDSALSAAERQFGGLLQASAAGLDVRLRLFHSPRIERSAFTLAQMRGRYAEIARLDEANLDAVVVTGAEPRAHNLRHEPFWVDLEWLVDWTARRRIPSFWSCLAAHAAVLALDGVDRSPLDSKRSGLFAWERVGVEPYLDPIAPAGVTPHSRYNDLSADALVARGYRILTWSPKAGVDLFSKRCGGLFIFAQGHPEYEADSLLREFRRDLGRWRVGDAPPIAPEGYFPHTIERKLKGLPLNAGCEPLMRSFNDATLGFTPLRPWGEGAARLFGGFLRVVAAEKRARGADAPANLTLQA
jgi:homoserine O-succinyltransferase